MEKSPYEIRLELLKLAADHLRDQHMWAREIVEREYDILSQFDNGTGDTRVNYQERLKEVKRILGKAPTPPTVDDIMREADKLRRFVDNRTVDKKPQLLAE